MYSFTKIKHSHCIAHLTYFYYVYTYITVNGGWGSWSEDTGCSVTCGGGVKVRTRSCTNPKPQNGGNPCKGESSLTATCNTDSCGGIAYKFEALK